MGAHSSLLERDIRETPIYRELEQLHRELLKPGSGSITGADELQVSPDGTRIAFTGFTVEKLEGTPSSRICVLDLTTAAMQVVTFGPHHDRSPRWLPDGRTIAFLSDRVRPGDFQLYLVDATTSESRQCAQVEGWIEYLALSPDGGRLLLGVAGHGADLAGAQGSKASKTRDEVEPWMPTVEHDEPDSGRRSLWVVDIASGTARHVSPEKLNPWEACWCGPDRIAAIASPGGTEADWYRATLDLIDVATGASRTVFTPEDQMGWPTANPSGTRLAVAAAVCSDRWVVAGDVVILDVARGEAVKADTRGVDVTDLHWCGDDTLVYAGHRSFETVAGRYRVGDEAGTELLATEAHTFGDMRYPRLAPLPGTDDSWVMLQESFLHPPSITRFSDGRITTLKTFLDEDGARLPEGTSVEALRWTAPDGLEIHGWLIAPTGDRPLPVVMDVHGGPVWLWRHRFLGRGGHHRLLLEHGCALFLPNPRGSSGRGQAFARRVFGDMGGADTGDYLSGLDHLVERGIVDPGRIGVTGGSYGGFMSNWLVTRDQRFAAAVPVASIGNWVSQHLVCNIPHFCQMFLDDEYTNLDGKYFARSPVFYANRVTTPCLNICGAEDRCTPPNQDMEFHRALRLHGVESALVTYPQEGHGPRQFPAIFDYSARVAGWFIRFLGLERA